MPTDEYDATRNDAAPGDSRSDILVGQSWMGMKDGIPVRRDVVAECSGRIAFVSTTGRSESITWFNDTPTFRAWVEATNAVLFTAPMGEAARRHALRLASDRAANGVERLALASLSTGSDAAAHVRHASKAFADAAEECGVVGKGMFP